MNQKKIIRLIAVVMAALLLLSLVVSVLPIRAHAEGFSSLEEAQAARDSARERASTARNKVQALKEEQAAVIEEKMALEEQTAACIDRQDPAAVQIGKHRQIRQQQEKGLPQQPIRGGKVRRKP